MTVCNTFLYLMNDVGTLKIKKYKVSSKNNKKKKCVPPLRVRNVYYIYYFTSHICVCTLLVHPVPNNFPITGFRY